MDFEMINKTMILTQFLALLLALSCSTKQKDTTAEDVVEIFSFQGIDLCELKKSSLKTIVDTTLSKPESIISSLKNNPNDEECLFTIIDKLATLEESSQEQLKALEKLNDISDGFLSEYFMEVCVDLFRSNFLVFTEYLFKNQNSSLINSLVEGFSMEISMADDRSTEKKELINGTIDKMKSMNYSDRQADFIKELLQKIDPSLFD
jgi:predicted outer membrane protein